MKRDYPSPCDTCQEGKECRHGYGCAQWQIRYRYRQKQINAYAKKVLPDYYERQKGISYEE